MAVAWGQAAPSVFQRFKSCQHLSPPPSCNVAGSSRRGACRQQLQHHHQQYQQQQQQQQQLRWQRPMHVAAVSGEPPVLPEGVDLSDPELQRQIDALLQELDPDMLMEDTGALLAAAEATAAAAGAGAGAAAAQQQAHTPSQQQQQRQGSQPQGPGAGSPPAAAAWQEEEGDEETEAGLPQGIVLSRAQYKRKAAMLLDLLAALRAGEGDEAAASDLLQQRLAAFRQEVDEAMLAMLARRLEAARQHGEEAGMVVQLEELQSLLTLEYERAQATPAMRLLDEVLDILGDDPTLPGGRQRAEAAIAALKAAFTGGASEGLDVFAAAAALAEDKALAAEVLSVEFVPQPVFLSECTQLLNQAREEMNALAEVVTAAQTELQQVRNTQPQLLEAPEAQQRIQQLAAADAALQQRKAALAQLALVLQLARDLDAALEGLQGPGHGTGGGAAAAQDQEQEEDDEAAAAVLMQDPERLAELLGMGGLLGGRGGDERAA